jgi:hypothetical protein
MGATGDLGGLRGHWFAMEVKPILLSVRGPTFLKSVCLLDRANTESNKRQDQRANADARLRAFANVPAMRTPKHWGTDVSLGSNLLEHLLQVIAQLDDRVEGHARMPLGSQARNHFRKPYSLRVTCGHI